MLPVLEFALRAAAAGGTAEPSVKQVEDWEGDLAYAELALGAGRAEVAEKVYRRWERVQPDTALAATRLGLMALARRKEDDAMALFARAMQMEGTPATAPFEYAMLLRERGGSRDEVKRYLRRAIELNPKLAEAQYLLGMMAAAEERHGEAIFHLEQALGVLPRQSLFWQGLAASYLANGEKEKARLAAGRAVEAAVSNEERNMAAGVLRQIEDGAPRLRSREPAPAGQQGAAPAVAAVERISGVLERIDCLGNDARFHVRSEGRLRTYWVEKPGEVLLKHASSLTFTFRCGVQAPAVQVVVEYRPKADGNRMTSGVVVGVEFR